MANVDVNAGFDALIAAVRDRLSRNLRIRRNLPNDGRLRVDRQLPFLCVHRSPPAAADVETRELVTTEAAYLFASGAPSQEHGLLRLCTAIFEILREHFGAFLLIELWAEDDRATTAPMDSLVRPGFRVIVPDRDSMPATIEALESGLRAIRVQGLSAEVTVEVAAEVAPPGLPSLGAACVGGCVPIGIGIRTVYRDPGSGAVFPVVLQALRRQLAIVLRKTVFAFTGRHSKRRHSNFESLGPTELVKAARLVDQQLCEASKAFDFVLQTIPINSATAWDEFQSSGYRREPTFHYRPLPYHPALLKRQLFEIPVDRVEDATLIQLFEQKQDHLDRQLTALKHIDTPAFFYDALQLYDEPKAELVELATHILDRVEHRTADRDDGPVHADQIVAAARDQIDFYHQRLPDFLATVHVRDDLASSMMVAQDRLYVASGAGVSRLRLAPLLHHEIGTHLLTYFNGRQQLFQQLCVGLAGYEALQEGLAVLAEYLTGGLTAGRLRTLACRVVAVRAMIDRRPFVDAFQLVHHEHRLPAKAAFMTTLRAYRGGGLAKDAIYLAGLRQLLDYLHDGHDLEPLYVGKIALEHVPLVQDLRRRAIVGPPALLPRFWEDELVQERLARCRRLSLVELWEDAP